MKQRSVRRLTIALVAKHCSAFALARSGPAGTPWAGIRVDFRFQNGVTLTITRCPTSWQRRMQSAIALVNAALLLWAWRLVRY